MQFFYIIAILTVGLPLITSLPSSQIAESSAVGTNEDAENTAAYMEISPRQIRRRAFDVLHGTLDLTEEFVNRVLYGFFGIPPSMPRGAAPYPPLTAPGVPGMPTGGSGSGAAATETPKL